MYRSQVILTLLVLVAFYNEGLYVVEPGNPMFRILVELFNERLHLGAFGICEKSAPPLFAGLQTSRPRRSLACTGGGTDHWQFGINARILCGYAEEATAAATGTLLHC